ncbi:MAG: hypothetical protein HFI35_03940 [Roseburia sp.]|jgi:hypothetical protein|nr:hypothetical protein [Roseburia sp.]
MQPYQEEYIANLKEIGALSALKKPDGISFDAYREKVRGDRKQVEQKIRRNMELLRSGLFPALDHLLESDEAGREELFCFAGRLLNPKEEWDAGLFCRIHQALLNTARLKNDRDGKIRELYWLGIGRNALCNKLVGLELSVTGEYVSQMRLCFTEAAAYLKYYDEIPDEETKGYILRSRANIALGQFQSVSERVRLLKQTLQIFEDPDYQDKAPGLPWGRYVAMTHQLMAASISYSRENSMTAQDITDIMESVYLVHERRMREAKEKHERPPVRTAFHIGAIEYYCGLGSFEELLTKTEKLMDEGELSDYSVDNMYAVISLPAFYLQFLQQYPEFIKGRTEYIESLYQRILQYVETFPDSAENATLFLYLRQVSHTFVETENSISYGEFLQKLLIRFAPDIFIHSYVVGKAASVFCGIILSEEPGFFDDIPEIAAVADPDKKRCAVTDYAMKCGAFHDVGKINIMDLYSGLARQWFEEEYEIAHLHAMIGWNCLNERASTKRYAQIAHGHHSWYDGSGHGYPASYRRLECDCRQMVDVIGLMDWMENVTGLVRFYTGNEKTFEEAADTAVTLEGRRFSPLLTARLRDPAIRKQLCGAFEEGRREAYQRLYQAGGGEHGKSGS